MHVYVVAPWCVHLLYLHVRPYRYTCMCMLFGSFQGPPSSPVPPSVATEGCCPASPSVIAEVMEETRAVNEMMKKQEKKRLHWFHKGDPTL